MMTWTPNKHSVLQVPTTQLAKMSIDLKFDELAAGVSQKILFYKTCPGGHGGEEETFFNKRLIGDGIVSMRLPSVDTKQNLYQSNPARKVVTKK